MTRISYVSLDIGKKDPFGNIITATKARVVSAKIFLVLNFIFLSYFWLNGVKDTLYVFFYYIFKRKIYKQYKYVLRTDVSNSTDRVLLLYPCCNDFVPNALEKSMQQNYKYFDVVILDDSNDESEKKIVDDFALKHNIKVVRRKDRVGFKAGNLNNYLKSQECLKKQYDYYVILDSDEIIPNNFIELALKYFYTFSNVGIVQANHISTNNSNFFMGLFHVGVNSHWPVYQSMKNYYGFSTMLGHGAMIKAECYNMLNEGFPNLVAEDLCISIELRSLGYYVVFAPNIICQEEYPIDYIAFKKRHSKWTQGNLEFIKKFTGKIIKSKMSWFEKLDIFLFTYNLPLTAIFAFNIFINIMILPIIGVSITKIFPIWLLIISTIFFFAPMLNDIIYWLFRMNIFRFVLYFFSVFMLYGSMLTISLISAILGVFGKKAKFVVTPKKSYRYRFLDIFRFHWKEILFSLFLLAISLVNFRNIWPVLLLVIPGICSIILIFFSNKRYPHSRTKTIDAKTARLSINKIQKDFLRYCDYDLKLPESFKQFYIQENCKTDKRSNNQINTNKN
ncbi:glycosyltransferase family 2 protein [Mycoplasmopsis mucosicanis]|uniref:glycosyltransferase family 2 protein n=1 Tax=Mycoplasmopsis mucosicanis TaxID=458208 RepID=UPI00147745E6|nr:glycosyltransferase family 2 protein [Mycoplasmopsis mucosicanis]